MSSYNSASGSYQVMMATGACAAVSGDSGTWTGTRTVGSGGGGYFMGGMQAPDRLPMQLTLKEKPFLSGLLAENRDGNGSLPRTRNLISEEVFTRPSTL